MRSAHNGAIGIPVALKFTLFVGVVVSVVVSTIAVFVAPKSRLRLVIDGSGFV